MAEESGISWTDATFNPWIGCTRVSPACDHCYAARDNERRDVLDPYEEVSTFTLRIKAADLAAYRGGTIDREEAKKRVQVQVF